MTPAATPYRPQMTRAELLARERRRKARRRKYMIRRIVALLVLIGLITLLVIGVKAIVNAVAKPDEPSADQKVDIILPSTYGIVRDDPEVTELSTEEETPEATEVPKEPTTEELLESGILTDDIKLSYDLQLVARDAAEEFGVPYKLLLAVMFRESSYNPNAANDICHGLMQIHQMNFEWLCGELAEYGVDDIKGEPEDNIYAGAFMLGRLIDKYGDYHKALMAYNCGETGARRLWQQGYTSSQYSRNVLATMESLDVAD